MPTSLYPSFKKTGFYAACIRISGEFNYLTLVSDDDVSNSTAQTQFRNISLSEMG
ncbi:hypothetical protein [Calothrix sp. CCY 0018]|uniref:hypothetical protein n=1 Tax=Calothrix sp. CCY 0018 TaxID=3103864 RepID=UPI0039C6558A